MATARTVGRAAAADGRRMSTDEESAPLVAAGRRKWGSEAGWWTAAGILTVCAIAVVVPWIVYGATSPPPEPGGCCPLGAVLCNFSAVAGADGRTSPDWFDDYYLMQTCGSPPPAAGLWYLLPTAVSCYSNGTRVTFPPAGFDARRDCQAYLWDRQPFSWGPYLNVSGPATDVECYRYRWDPPLTACTCDVY